VTSARSCIVVFGREPLPGRAKTRLSVGIGDAAAARVGQVLLQQTLTAALATRLPVTLALADEPTAALALPAGIELAIQPEGDLGQRMAAAFREAFDAGHDRVVLVGTDIPGLRAEHLLAARGRLTAVPVVLGPARDGGYYLVAQRAPGLDLFTEIPWSSPDTLMATRRRIEAHGAFHREIEPLGDVDTEADLRAALGDPDLPDALCDALRAALEGT